MKLIKLLSHIVIISLAAGSIYAEQNLKNEIGFTWDESYISDLKAWWTYSSAYYYHDFDKGRAGARVNHGVKFGGSGEQYQLEIYPRITDFAYLSLTGATAGNNQIIYPSKQYTAEAYFNIANEEFSLGQYGNFYSMFEGQKFYTYTGSAGIYFGEYFAWARVNLYTFEHANFYLFGVRRYFSDTDKDRNVALIVNVGSMPDIGDVPPFGKLIKMSQMGIALFGSALLFNSVYLKWLVGYAHMLYPHHHIRNETDFMLGLAWKF